jgi:hypothetical protein
MRAAINPPKWAENIKLPYLWLRNDGGTEPKKGALRFVLLVRIPFRGKVARTISARHALLTDPNPRAKSRTAHYKQAKLNSRNLLNIAIAASRRQHGGRNESGQARERGSSQGTRDWRTLDLRPCRTIFRTSRPSSPQLPDQSAPAFIAPMLKKSAQESTLNTLLLYAHSTDFQEAGKRGPLPTVFVPGGNHGCPGAVYIIHGRLWRLKIHQQRCRCSHGESCLGLPGGRTGHVH